MIVHNNGYELYLYDLERLWLSALVNGKLQVEWWINADMGFLILAQLSLLLSIFIRVRSLWIIGLASGIVLCLSLISVTGSFMLNQWWMALAIVYGVLLAVMFPRAGARG
ncbi:hypothetical protein DF182_19935 [Chitinophaga flava]|uniref:Uncharacterized protein n=2 Tax=Chitinophaga flava TaxID=2259036 RepID=A0A365XS30_9BACT|nr:hypothetical protein DF182_19935 [Chitinophaga flava]